MVLILWLDRIYCTVYILNQNILASLIKIIFSFIFKIVFKPDELIFVYLFYVNIYIYEYIF